MAGQDVVWVSVWCKQYSVNFGHALLLSDEEGAAEVEPEAEPESGVGHGEHGLCLLSVLLLSMYRVF